MASDRPADPAASSDPPGMVSETDHELETPGTGSLTEDIRHQVELEQALLDSQKRLKEREEQVVKYKVEERHLLEEKDGARESYSVVSKAIPVKRKLLPSQ